MERSLVAPSGVAWMDRDSWTGSPQNRCTSSTRPRSVSVARRLLLCMAIILVASLFGVDATAQGTPIQYYAKALILYNNSPEEFATRPLRAYYSRVIRVCSSDGVVTTRERVRRAMEDEADGLESRGVLVKPAGSYRRVYAVVRYAGAQDLPAGVDPAEAMENNTLREIEQGRQGAPVGYFVSLAVQETRCAT